MAGEERDYIELAKTYILSYLQHGYAATGAELEARCAERDGTTRVLVDVNHAITARSELLAEGLIEATGPARTRGGREIPVFHVPIARGNARLVDDAAKRKRLLLGRWQSWASGNARYPKGLIGPAGDRVLAASVTDESLRTRYLPVEPSGGEVRSLFGARVPGGPLDSAAYIVARAGGVAGGPVLLPMEIKNVRHWLFPKAVELFQGLDKGAQLVAHNPGVEIAPVIVCRRRHHTTFNMATDLGIFIVEVHRQFMLPSAYAPADRVEEVRSGLGFYFLAQTVDPDPILLRVFRDTIPERAERMADRFRATVPLLAPYYQSLRGAALSRRARDDVFDEFRAAALAIPGSAGGW